MPIRWVTAFCGWYGTTGVDCDDDTPSVVSSSTLDPDCDGVPTAVDCDDDDDAVRNTSTADKDCDLVPTTSDCNDDNSAVTNTRTNDRDCDLMPTTSDCNDNDAAVTRTRTNDRDCDGVETAIDCDDANANMTASRIGDADCDGVGTAIDCDDSAWSIKNTHTDDADCDLVPTAADCDDADAAVKIAWSSWRHLGEAMKVTSNVNHHLACRPSVVTGGTDVSGGSLAKGTGGPVSCELLGEVADACPGVVPVGLGWGPYGPSLAGADNYYYWDGSTTANWPTHDPCGTDRPNHVGDVATPRGAVWLKH